jgi:hypothetical protein
MIKCFIRIIWAFLYGFISFKAIVFGNVAYSKFKGPNKLKWGPNDGVNKFNLVFFFITIIILKRYTTLFKGIYRTHNFNFKRMVPGRDYILHIR